MFKIRQLLSYLATLDELRASCHAGRRRPIFQLEACVLDYGRSYDAGT